MLAIKSHNSCFWALSLSFSLPVRVVLPALRCLSPPTLPGEQTLRMKRSLKLPASRCRVDASLRWSAPFRTAESAPKSPQTPDSLYFQRERIHERCKTICPLKDDVDAVSSITTNHGNDWPRPEGRERSIRIWGLGHSVTFRDGSTRTHDWRRRKSSSMHPDSVVPKQYLLFILVVLHHSHAAVDAVYTLFIHIRTSSLIHLGFHFCAFKEQL